MTNSPEWRDNLLAKVERDQDGRKEARGPLPSHLMRVSWAVVQLINTAAKARGISSSGYCRRAVAKQLAADLGVPILDILHEMPVPGPYVGKIPHGGPNTRERADYVEKMKPWATEGNKLPDDGEGYGDWGW